MGHTDETEESVRNGSDGGGKSNCGCFSPAAG